METNNKYSKKEKLKSKKAIDNLFENGLAINGSFLRAIYLPNNETNSCTIKMGVSVPKKNIKLAVDRNLIKRRIREAYRINNNELKTHLSKINLQINVMFIYTTKQILPYKEIEGKIKVILTRLIELSEVASE